MWTGDSATTSLMDIARTTCWVFLLSDPIRLHKWSGTRMNHQMTGTHFWGKLLWQIYIEISWFVHPVMPEAVSAKNSFAVCHKKNKNWYRIKRKRQRKWNNTRLDNQSTPEYCVLRQKNRFLFLFLLTHWCKN